MDSLAPPLDRIHERTVRRALIASAIGTLALYVVPFGRYAVYPLMLLSTLAHELGHGLAALAVGGTFERFEMFADGSGLALVRGVEPGWRSAAVAAGGLVGPALAAALAFRAVRWRGAARAGLGLLALALLTALVLVVRNAFGLAFVGALAAALAWICARRPAADAQVVLAFLAVQLGLSVFARGDYLFTRTAQTGSGPVPSDAANMAADLIGPYWAWGLLCGLFSVLVLVLGLRGALR